MDYGIRSIFGVVSKWPDTVLICWSLITLMFPFIAGFFALKIKISYSVLEKVINICILPSVLFIYYALPSEFTTLKIEKPLKNGARPPVHFILFDMLSYDFIFQNNPIVDFKSGLFKMKKLIRNIQILNHSQRQPISI